MRAGRLRSPGRPEQAAGASPESAGASPESAGASPERAPDAGAPGHRASAEPDFDRERTLAEVREGLNRPQKELSPKYFYDRRGSELFEAITELPEYYLTRTERALLEAWAPTLVAERQPATLVELGAGSARKTRILLDPMLAAAARSAREPLYVPVDLSAVFLEATAGQLRAEYPDLAVAPLVADIAGPLDLPHDLPRPALFALLGSTIGNFTHEAAAALLAGLRAAMAPDDLLLLGVDLRPGPGKSLAELEAAYDDARGVTAEFNRNLFVVLNRVLGTDFDPAAFHHRAFYDAEHGRIEMHLVADRPLAIRLPGGERVPLARGESIRTEISCKYDRAAVDDLFDRAGLRVAEWRQDALDRFALVLGVPLHS